MNAQLEGETINTKKLNQMSFGAIAGAAGGAIACMFGSSTKKKIFKPDRIIKKKNIDPMWDASNVMELLRVIESKCKIPKAYKVELLENDNASCLRKDKNCVAPLIESRIVQFEQTISFELLDISKLNNKT